MRRRLTRQRSIFTSTCAMLALGCMPDEWKREVREAFERVDHGADMQWRPAATVGPSRVSGLISAP